MKRLARERNDTPSARRTRRHWLVGLRASIELVGGISRAGVALHHAHDLVERLGIPHRVVDGIVVMGCPPEPLPALRVAPVPVEAGPEVADTAARVPEWIVDSSPIEHAGDPLPVVGGVVAHEDGPSAAQVILEPGREPLGDFRVGCEAGANDGYRWILGVWGRVEEASVKRFTRVVVNGSELGKHAVYWAGATRLTVDEYPWCVLAHPAQIVLESFPG